MYEGWPVCCSQYSRHRGLVATVIKGLFGRSKGLSQILDALVQWVMTGESAGCSLEAEINMVHWSRLALAWT